MAEQQKWEYELLTIAGDDSEGEIAKAAGKALTGAQELGFSYVSGPDIQRYPGGQATYTFLTRKPMEKTPGQFVAV